jgi:hypothetical protein
VKSIELIPNEVPMDRGFRDRNYSNLKFIIRCTCAIGSGTACYFYPNPHQVDRSLDVQRDRTSCRFNRTSSRVTTLQAGLGRLATGWPSFAVQPIFLSSFIRPPHTTCLPPGLFPLSGILPLLPRPTHKPGFFTQLFSHLPLTQSASYIIIRT